MVRKMKFENFFCWFQFFHPCGLRCDWKYENALIGSTLQFSSYGLAIIHSLDSPLQKENSTCRRKIIKKYYYETKGDSWNIFFQSNWHVEIILWNFDFFQFFNCLLRAVFMYKTFIKNCVFWKRAFFIICWKDIKIFCDIAHADPSIYPKVSFDEILEQFDTWKRFN